MITKTAGAGFYHSPGWNKDFPKLHILTIEELLAGKKVQLPPNLQTFKKAETISSDSSEQSLLEFEP
jgi:site-specific DNA-methyltransferase (adenine-specific)